MGIPVITVDLECCCCRAKITKVLDCLKEEFCIEKVEFEDKKEKKVVVVRGKFDAEQLCKKVWCKAGKVVKEIVIAEVWPMPPPPKPCTPCKPKPEESKPKPEDLKPEKKCCVCEHCKPKPEKRCVCDRCKPKPKPEEKPKPAPPKTEYKLVPYPYPVPNPGMCQSWPWQCPPHQQCQCCQKAASSSTAAAAANVQLFEPRNCGCGQTPPVWPPPWAGCNVVTDENSCSVMCCCAVISAGPPISE